MKTELMASTNTENTIELTTIDPITTIAITQPISELVALVEFIMTQLTNPLMPATTTIPQNTSKPVMISATESRGKNRERIPIVVLAAGIKPQPVTDITITELWLRIFNRFYKFLRHIETRHKQIATAMFLVRLRYESISSLANLTTEIIMAANAMDPKADVNSHLQALAKQLPCTSQYQKEQATAMVKTVMQQKRKPISRYTNTHRTVTTPYAVLSSFLLVLSLATDQMHARVQSHIAVNKKVRNSLTIGARNTPHRYLMN